MQWTNEQQRAITQPGSLLVSAAAGSGKTAVLTERIAQLVAEGCPLDRFLVITFTRAAAGEMKKRIAGRLSQMAQMCIRDRRKAPLPRRLKLAFAPLWDTMPPFFYKGPKDPYG